MSEMCLISSAWMLRGLEIPQYSFVGKNGNNFKSFPLPFSGFVAQGQQRQGVLALLLQRRLLLLVEGDGEETYRVTNLLAGLD